MSETVKRPRATRLATSESIGKLADIMVLSGDILTVPEEEIPDAAVL